MRDVKGGRAVAYDKVVDADGHILEPKDVWENYLESKYSGRGIYFRSTPHGGEYLEIDGRARGGQDARDRRGLGLLGGVGGYPEKDGSRARHMRAEIMYEESAPPGAMDPHQRVEVLDQEGIDIAFIYPTIGILWESDVNDPDLDAALCRAYNNWLVDFCKPYPDRLYAVAHISILDVEGAVAEMERMASLGAKGFFLRPDLVNGRTLGHPAYDPLWAAAQEMELPIAPHVVTHNLPMTEWVDTMNPMTPGVGFGGPTTLVFGFTYLSLPIVASFTAMMTAGVFERFPRLKFVILECGGGWLAHWLERMDTKYEVSRSHSPLKEKPSFYFRRQCAVSVDPDEKTIVAMSELLGEDKLVWASDFPHIDAEYGVVGELKENMAGLSATAQRKILGENAARLYSLPM